MPFDELEFEPGCYEGFIFDCDGTLADTMPLHHRAWCHALQLAGAAFDFNWSLFMSRAGMSLERTVSELNEQFGTRLDPERIASAQREHFDQALDRVRPIEPVVTFLATVAREHRVSVASGSPHHQVVHTLELIGARSHFEIIVTPADVVHGKPAPDMFLLAAERMRVAPERCLVLEDSWLGIEAAQRAGMHSALVRPPAPPGSA
jgi:HAD superfamily hydrolase (TIGR01509 family)